MAVDKKIKRFRFRYNKEWAFIGHVLEVWPTDDTPVFSRREAKALFDFMKKTMGFK